MSQTKANGSLWLPSLLEALERQGGVLDRLEGLSHAQSTAIARGNGDQLLELLGRRQVLIDQLLAGQRDMSALTSDLRDRMQAIAPLQRERVAAMVKLLGERLASVLERDEHDRGVLGALGQSRPASARYVSARHVTRAYRTVAGTPSPARCG